MSERHHHHEHHECGRHHNHHEHHECIFHELEERLNHLKHELEHIEEKLDHPGFGLFEIKKEICAIEQRLNCPGTNPFQLLLEIRQEVLAIEAKLDNPEFGLAHIKSEIRTIENEVLSNDHGLGEIKREVRIIENEVLSSDHGLAEIKREIRQILNQLPPSPPGQCGTVTTGPVIVDTSGNYALVKILNDSTSPANLTIKLFNLNCTMNTVTSTPIANPTTCQKTSVYTQTVTLAPNRVVEFAFQLTVPDTATKIDNFEVVISGVGANIFAFVTTAPNPTSGNLQSANTFRPTELSCTTTDP